MRLIVAGILAALLNVDSAPVHAVIIQPSVDGGSAGQDPTPVAGQPESETSAREESVAEIEAAVAGYRDAFNAGDAEALAQFWSPEGVYLNRETGEQVTGRDAIADALRAQFDSDAQARLELESSSIEFVSPNVAFETGMATIVFEGEAPIRTPYRCVFVRRDGQWLIDRVTEDAAEPLPATGYEQLQELEWMVGNWIDASGEGLVRLDCAWTRNRSFLTRSFAVTTAEGTDFAGIQVIGWDPANEQIRSWVFDSDGGFAEGTWTRDEDRWVVSTTATLSDGARASSDSILRPIDENHFGWQQVNRIVDGEILPNLDEVIVVRNSNPDLNPPPGLPAAIR